MYARRITWTAPLCTGFLGDKMQSLYGFSPEQCTFYCSNFETSVVVWSEFIVCA